MSTNAQICLARRPEWALSADDFTLVEAPRPEPAVGQMLVQNEYLSIDPAIRQWIGGKGRYIPPIAPGDVVRSVVLGRVMESSMDGYAPGDWVRGLGGWQNYSLLDSRCFPNRIDAIPGIPVTAHLGVLGGPGLAAYFGLFAVGQCRAEETVLVSSAAGAVGMLVGQLAREVGARAIGITSAVVKAQWLLKQALYDEVICVPADGLRQAIATHAPHGVDLYFDNLGGPTLEAALSRLAPRGRVVLCGATSQYDAATPPTGPANYLCLLEQGARMEGFTAAQFASRFPEAIDFLSQRMLTGALKLPVEIVQGFDAAPSSLVRLLAGGVMGKLLVQLSP